MSTQYCSLNGQLIPRNKAKLAVDHLEFTYGFGVYENISLRKKRIYFLDEHIKRLFISARIINLMHTFEKSKIKTWVHKLADKNNTDNANIKIILIGGDKPLLYIFMLPPRYVEKKEYRQGVKAISYKYERFLPQAKTLNMLPSYVIFKKAQAQNAYDALLIDKDENALEGTRSNFFTIKNKMLYTPPVTKILDGVTRRSVIKCAKQNGFKIIERNIPFNTIFDYDGAFFTNTSGKIVPVKTIDKKSFKQIAKELQELRRQYNDYIK